VLSYTLIDVILILHNYKIKLFIPGDPGYPGVPGDPGNPDTN